jgi:hypothetical protein
MGSKTGQQGKQWLERGRLLTFCHAGLDVAGNEAVHADAQGSQLSGQGSG